MSSTVIVVLYGRRLIMYCWYLALYVGYMILLLVVGSVIGLKIFRQNDYGARRRTAQEPDT